MLARILRIKGCLASALLNFEKTDIEFTSRDFELMRKVTMILRFYHEATQMLSEDDCSVSMSIPIVATISKALQVHSSNTGVKTLKNGLHEYFLIFLLLLQLFIYEITACKYLRYRNLC